jgi:hypothetical protein
MRAFALVSDLAPAEAVELYLREEEAVKAMEAAIGDEPQWVDVLRVEPVVLDGIRPTAN